MSDQIEGCIARLSEIATIEIELRLKQNDAHFDLAHEILTRSPNSIPHIIFATITVPGNGERIEVCRASRLGDASKQLELVHYR